jgi:hypothetical protein
MVAHIRIQSMDTPSTTVKSTVTKAATASPKTVTKTTPKAIPISTIGGDRGTFTPKPTVTKAGAVTSTPTSSGLGAVTRAPGPVIDTKPVPPIQDRIDVAPITPQQQLVIIPLDKVVYTFPGVTKDTQPVFEKVSETFAKNRPAILNILQYIVEGQVLGVLIVWRKFQDATHYEIFKKNIFKDNPLYERILFLDAVSLRQETDRYIKYATDLGLPLDPMQVYIAFDPLVKEDRIYEYKVKASRLAASEKEIDYDFILQSRDATYTIDLTGVASAGNLFDFAREAPSVYSADLAWSVALLNKISFFGTQSTLPITQFTQKILVAKNINNIMEILKTSFSFFGEIKSLVHMVKVLGGLSKEFVLAFQNSLSENDNTFSYSLFNTQLRSQISVFSVLVSISETKDNATALAELAKLSINLPRKTGVEYFTSPGGLSNIFNYINAMYLAIINTQLNNNAEAIRKIFEKLVNKEVAPIVAHAERSTAVVANIGKTSEKKFPKSTFDTASGVLKPGSTTGGTTTTTPGVIKNIK